MEFGNGPTVVVTVEGELDAVAARALAVLLDCAIEQRPQNLVIDLSDYPSVDVSVIGLLVDSHRRAWQAGCLIAVRCPSPRVRHILEGVHWDHPLDITPLAAPQPGPDAQAATGRAAVAAVQQ
ncbi:STAS domain-containing protein [Planosporangium sp. 12N6]|uniref:STAS domain-containing protein n=1 Tax=Planosporangium spinosum TaxID=3402278 RepID=UPI003CF74642